MEGRQLPRNIEAERGLLGALFVDNRAYENVCYIITSPQQFALTAHARVYEAMSQVIERGEVADPITLRRFFENDDCFDDLGGAAQYLAHLAASAISVINAPEYARIIVEADQRRSLIHVSEDLAIRAYDYDIDVPAREIIENAEEQLFHIAEGRNVNSDQQTTTLDAAMNIALQEAEQAWKNEGRVLGLETGFEDLSRKLGGLRDTNLIILAGRPAMGKTALAVQIAQNIAADGFTVGVDELEMSQEQLAQRMMCQRARISTHDINSGKLDKKGFTDLIAAKQELSGLPMIIDDTSGLTIGQIRTRARRMKRKHDIRLLVVDYLQLIEAGRRVSGRTEAVTHISQQLKIMAKELRIPVLALSQLSRNVETRDDKRPTLKDLRESGSIEQDADVVMFLYREEYYLENAEPRQKAEESDDKFTARVASWNTRLEKAQNLAEVIIAKNRHGPVGTTRLHFEGEFAKFSSWAEDPE